MKVGKMIMEWDISKRIQDEIDYWKEVRADEIKNGDITIEDIESSVYDDYDLITSNYEYLTEYLTERMNKKNPDGYWKAVVNNFGWRSQNGYQYVEADKGSELLSAVLPKCDCTFRIHNYGKGFAIQNFHHDSPTGNEWYYITPAAASTYYKNVA
jgi:hypothetical protein